MEGDRQGQAHDLAAHLEAILGGKRSEIFSDCQKLLSDIQNVTHSVGQKEQEIASVRKELIDTQWYFGEEKVKTQQLDEELRRVQGLLQEKDDYIRQLQDSLQALQRQREEAEWYLGEERTKREQHERTLGESSARCQYLESQLTQLQVQLQSVQKELQDTQWFLGEERAKHHAPC